MKKSEGSMDPDKRIEELEAQVRHLTDMVAGLLASKGQDGGTGGEESSTEPVAEAASHESGITELVSDVRRTVERVLDSSDGDSLEARIGSVWLSRLMVVALMTTVALGALTTFTTESLEAWQKVVIGYGIAGAGLAYGVAQRKSTSPFPQTILGAGLAILYFTTYAGFFVETIHVFTTRWAAIPVLFVCLLFLAGVAHWRRSQTTASIALFLVYYTVVVTCTSGLTADHLLYAFGTCAALSLVAFVFHAWHRWMLFSWVALVATYGTYVFYFLGKPIELPISEQTYFWYSNGFIALCYLLFSVGCVIDARRTGEYRRLAAPMAGLNSIAFFLLTGLAIRHQYPAEEWMFRLAFAVSLAAFAFLAETTGPRRNYLFQVFAAKSVIMFTLAVESLLSGERLLIALAIECLALALAYWRSGVVLFKVLDHMLMLVVFVVCLFSVKLPGTAQLAGYTFPANWTACVGVVIVFAAVAWFYEQFAHGATPERRTRSGQWFLAETFLDVHNTTASVLHAASGALILLTITIIDRGEDPQLPFLLAAESAVLATAGILLRTPQLEVASVLLLITAHISYHFFLVVEKAGFESQARFVEFTILVASLTYIAAYLWERYLKRVEEGKPWEHYVVASIPYLVATYLLTDLMSRNLDGVYAPLAQNTLGVALLLVGCVFGLAAVKASGVVAMILGTVTFCRRLYLPDTPLLPQEYFVGYLALTVFTYAAGERLFILLQQQERDPSKAEDYVRTLLVVTAAAIGIIGLQEWSDKSYLTLYWLGHGVLGMALGAMFGERRYRWSALIVMVIAMGRAFVHDIMALPNLYRVLSFAGITLAFLVISWAYSKFRPRPHRSESHPSKESPASHG
ncbi:MAG: DUF2339 domain-containing protein [Candidatus Hydrogenedentes bacterium]|nr:DUF2339 domain-containing protein [Candidatus Hydrogenedentota bacterium]